VNRVETLSENFSQVKHISFEQLDTGLVLAHIDNPLSTAVVSLYGGQVLAWQPKTQSSPVLWRSSLANLISGKPIRAGIPLCWPWFGPHPTEPDYPSHGFARTMDWQLESVVTQTDGSTQVQLSMPASLSASGVELDKRDQAQLAPHQLMSVQLSLKILIGETLTLELTTCNLGNIDFEFSEALHAYFTVSDISKIVVKGLDDCDYIDTVNAGIRGRQQGVISFAERLDRVYVNTSSACQIEDPVLNRGIQITKVGSLSTVVWNPWLETASQMQDLGSEGWRSMVCVESANALENIVTLKPKARHSLGVTYAVVQLK
jgi:D-hexose-6-phosphate mutarotase